MEATSSHHHTAKMDPVSAVFNKYKMLELLDKEYTLGIPIMNSTAGDRVELPGSSSSNLTMQDQGNKRVFKEIGNGVDDGQSNGPKRAKIGEAGAESPLGNPRAESSILQLLKVGQNQSNKERIAREDMVYKYHYDKIKNEFDNLKKSALGSGFEQNRENLSILGKILEKKYKVFLLDLYRINFAGYNDKASKHDLLSNKIIFYLAGHPPTSIQDVLEVLFAFKEDTFLMPIRSEPENGVYKSTYWKLMEANASRIYRLMTGQTKMGELLQLPCIRCRGKGCSSYYFCKGKRARKQRAADLKKKMSEAEKKLPLSNEELFENREKPEEQLAKKRTELDRSNTEKELFLAERNWHSLVKYIDMKLEKEASSGKDEKELSN